ncbi:hypothetical protein JAAARDRAFT_183725, partial [Jaapia argillacea MUCL 33604]
MALEQDSRHMPRNRPLHRCRKQSWSNGSKSWLVRGFLLPLRCFWIMLEILPMPMLVNLGC